MLLTLYTEDYFNAAHFLSGYDGKCSALHGHSWKVCVWIRGDEKDKNNVGILWDFNNLKKLINEFDHKCLNDIIKENPTVENLVVYFYNKLKTNDSKLLFKVRIYESITKKESFCEFGDF